MKELLLLGLLLDGKKHGYQLNESFKHSFSMYADLKKSTAYYTLNKLEKDGYVIHETEREGNRPERRVYELTDTGRDHFFDLLRQNLSDFSRTYYDDDVGIAFMNGLSKQEVKNLLSEKQKKAQAALKLYQDHLEIVTDRSWRYVIEHNIVHLEAEVNWLAKVQADLVKTS